MWTKVTNAYNQFLRWLVGRAVYESHLTESHNRLAAALNFLIILVVLLYTVIDVILGNHNLHLIRLIIFLGSLSGIILFRYKRILLSKIVVLLIVNIATYLVADAGQYETGSHFYFFSLMIAAFVVFDHEGLKLGFFFALLSAGLYLLMILADFSVLAEIDYSAWSTRLNFIINLSIFTIVTFLIIMSYIRMIHKRNSKIREQNERLAQTNSELDQFLYSTSHDLKAPLASVIGLIEMAEGTANMFLIREYLDLMKSKTNRMDDFLDEIMDVIRNSRMPVRKTSLDIHTVADTVFQNLSHMPGAKEVTFKNHISESLRMNSDEWRIKSILSNLFSNAIKYSDEEKEDRFVEINGTEREGEFQLIVSDNGIGIDGEQLSSVFNMFHRATSKSTGTGLGLYIARETIKSLNGEITVDSSEGEGSTFQVVFPNN